MPFFLHFQESKISRAFDGQFQKWFKPLCHALSNFYAYRLKMSHIYCVCNFTFQWYLSNPNTWGRHCVLPTLLKKRVSEEHNEICQSLQKILHSSSTQRRNSIEDSSLQFLCVFVHSCMVVDSLILGECCCKLCQKADCRVQSYFSRFNNKT